MAWLIEPRGEPIALVAPPLATRLTAWRKDMAAGAIAAIVTLPVCVAAGVLVFAPLGPTFAATGAAAGLAGAIVSGGVAALVATSSFVNTSPRVSASLILASLITALMANPAVGGDTGLILIAVFACALLAGLWQAAFGLAGVAKVIKFTPHPVLVGFLNGVAIVIAVSQVKPHLMPGGGRQVALFERPGMFVLLLAVAGSMLAYPALAKRMPAAWSLARVPPVLAAFVAGTAAYYLAHALSPALDLGPTVGTVQVTFVSPLVALDDAETWRRIAWLWWEIVPISVIVAIVATLDTLLAFRTAQNISDVAISPVRDLFAQGVGNIVGAAAGGVTGAASPSPTIASYRAGGRTRRAPIATALILLMVAALLPQGLAYIPAVVLSGILLAVGILLFDAWTFQLIDDLRTEPSPLNRRRSLYDLAVVVIVMSITVLYSVVAGVVAGCLLAGIIFVMNMSRPVVRRAHFGNEISSKRIRPARDAAILHDTGDQRVVLQLEGVLFFGNADDLASKITELFRAAEMIALDMRAVNDIDVSGAKILANLISKSRTLNKTLLFCEVASAHIGVVRALVPKDVRADDLIKPDLDSALEWMEEHSLLLYADRRGRVDVLALSEIDFLAGLEAAELERLSAVLKRREFATGDVICRQGEEGDRMWLLAKGSVSVQLRPADGSEPRRIASLARGTTVGEMALVESTRRSATIVADEPIVSYELDRDGFARTLAEHPAVAIRLLSNLARELARRLRRTSEDLRNRS